MIRMLLYTISKYLIYFDGANIDKEDSSHEMVVKYKRLMQILSDVIKSRMSNEQVAIQYENEIMKLFHQIKNKEFVCKVSRVAFLEGYSILAEFWGGYYTKIDLEIYMRENTCMKMLYDKKIFESVHPQEYHVFFGPQFEVDISSDFIWHCGENVTGKINPKEYEWIS